jgi:Flp pilus assembly protein TadD
MAERVKDAPARPSRFDLTWNEELVLAVIAVGVFFAMRGTIGVPLLFASGIAVCATYLAWLAYHTLSARDARLHRVQLKSGGQVQPAGYGLIALTALSLGGLAYVGVLNAAIALADFSRDKITVPPGVVFSGTKVAPDAPVARLAERARSLYTLALPAPDGIGVRGPWTRNIEGSLIWVSSVLGDYSGAEARVDAMISRDGLDEATAAARARVIRGDGRLEDALRFSESTWRAHPAWGGLREELVTWLLEDGRREEAVAIAREAVAKDPNDLTAMRRLSLVLVDSDFNAEVEEGLALVERTLEIAPGNPFAMRARATAMRKLGRFVEAERVLREAIELSPNTWQLHQELGEMLMAGDRAREAASILKRAGELRLQSLQNPAR